LGSAVRIISDTNNDGNDDLLVGSPGAASFRGAAYLFYGGNFTLGTVFGSNADRIFLGRMPGDMLGSTVSEAGDVNGDGMIDVITGAVNANPDGNQSGEAYIFRGGNYSGYSIADSADVILRGTYPNGSFGFSINSLGDANADGFDDVAVGAPFADSDGYSTGEVSIFYGGIQGGIRDANTADLIIKGSGNYNEFGSAIYGVGDVNGDGRCDILTGAPGAPGAPGVEDSGEVYLFLGGNLSGTTNTAGADVFFQGALEGIRFGEQIMH